MAVASTVRPSLLGAQQKAMPVIGVLHTAVPNQVVDLMGAFRTGLKESGFTEGQNRWAEDDYERLPALVADLIARNVDVIATGGGDRSEIDDIYLVVSCLGLVAMISGLPR
jgi:putative tryptophan/tyrosine transport system substrate-binding protein